MVTDTIQQFIHKRIPLRMATIGLISDDDEIGRMFFSLHIGLASK